MQPFATACRPSAWGVALGGKLPMAAVMPVHPELRELWIANHAPVLTQRRAKARSGTVLVLVGLLLWVGGGRVIAATVAHHEPAPAAPIAPAPPPAVVAPAPAPAPAPQGAPSAPRVTRVV